MTAAVALTVVLVIAVAGMSLAMQTQRPAQPQQRVPRPPRPPAPPRRTRERRAPAPPPEPVTEAETKLPEPKKPELLRSGAKADAKVLSVVDERTLGPVTRSRLQLRVEDGDGGPFEVTVRVAFQSPAERSRVKVGGTVPVRYDPDDHARVVLDSPDES